jgi:hypothetical protein
MKTSGEAILRCWQDVTEIQISVDGLALATTRSQRLSGLAQRDVYMAQDAVRQAAAGQDDGRTSTPEAAFRSASTALADQRYARLVGQADADAWLRSNASIAAMKKTNGKPSIRRFCQGIRGMAPSSKRAKVISSSEA